MQQPVGSWWHAVVVVAWCAGSAHADSIKHPAGYELQLPEIGFDWEQEKKGDQIIVQTGEPTEVTIYLLPGTAKATTAAYVERNVVAELARIKIEGQAVKQAVPSEATSDQFGNGKTLILIAIPSPRFEERAFANFRAVVKGLTPRPPRRGPPRHPPPTSGRSRNCRRWSASRPSPRARRSPTRRSPIATRRGGAPVPVDVGGHPQKPRGAKASPTSASARASRSCSPADPARRDPGRAGVLERLRRCSRPKLVTSIEVTVDGKTTRASAGARANGSPCRPRERSRHSRSRSPARPPAR